MIMFENSFFYKFQKEEREALFVKSYLLRVTEACDPDTCEKFLRVLGKHQYSTISPVKVSGFVQ